MDIRDGRYVIDPFPFAGATTVSLAAPLAAIAVIPLVGPIGQRVVPAPAAADPAPGPDPAATPSPG
jgi:hypothetical protein